MDLVNGDSDWHLELTSSVEENTQQLQQQEDRRWIYKDEVSKVFDDTIKTSFPELDEEEDAEIMTCPKGVPDDYVCLNVLSIWPQLRKSPELRNLYPHIGNARDIGKAIRKNLPKSAKDMIKQCSVRDIGYVTFSLSRKWMAQSIHKMIKDGIDTWAPKLPVERVYVDSPTLDEEDIHVGLFRRQAIECTLIRMLTYSKVTVWSKETFGGRDFKGHDILKRWFSIKEIQGEEGNVVIDAEGQLPFILAKRDFIHLLKDLEALRYVIEEKKPDWIVYVTPVRQQEYIEMCFTAAKLEKWIQSDMEGKWDPSQENEYPVLTYAGYRSCGTKQDELNKLLNEVKTRCVEVAEGTAAKLLGYNAEEVLNCVLAYTFLKTRRLDDCTLSEMVNEEENTFVYLLNRRAEIRTITENSREDIDELKMASQLILEDVEECGKGEERILEFKLLEFSGALEESCLFVIPHILCEYLYELCKKFTSYYSSVYKVGSVVKKNTLLLCEATAVVMEKCFHLLGITPELSTLLRSESSAKQPMDVNAPVAIEVDTGTLEAGYFEDRCIIPSYVSVARDQPRNSRFEVVEMRPTVTQDSATITGRLFGIIAVSDKYGLRSDGAYHLCEPDFAYVPIFDLDWRHPIRVLSGGFLDLANPGTRHLIPFSSSIVLRMELYVATNRKDGCFQLCSHKSVIELSDFWKKKADSMCGDLYAKGEGGSTRLHYILIKDAIDTSLKVRFKTDKIDGHRVSGHICAYYGSEFQYGNADKDSYTSILFQCDFPILLKDGCKIRLKKSMMAVPKNASLIIKAVLFEGDESMQLILHDFWEFIMPTIGKETKGSCKGYIDGKKGSGCSLDLELGWKYQA